MKDGGAIYIFRLFTIMVLKNGLSYQKFQNAAGLFRNGHLEKRTQRWTWRWTWEMNMGYGHCDGYDAHHMDCCCVGDVA